MIRLEDNPDILKVSLNSIPVDREDNQLIDIRGNLLFYFRSSSTKPIGKLFGYNITIQDLIRDDCRFRLHQKSKYSSLKLKFYHKSWKLVFKFSVKDSISTQRFWKMQLQQVIPELAQSQYFDGVYTNTIFRQPDTVVLEKARFEELKTRAELWDKTPKHMTGMWENHVPPEPAKIGDLQTLSTLALLEEVERRYKEANPDWATDLLARQKPDDDELQSRVIALFGT
jgi:hypothetical protein